MSIFFDPEPDAAAAAVEIGSIATRGNKLAIALVIDYAAIDVWESTLWAILGIYRHLARELRNPIDMHAELLAIANDDEHLCRRRGAAILAAYNSAADATDLGDTELRWHAIEELNHALAEANESDLFTPTLVAAIETCHQLCPEITPAQIQFAAHSLWS